MHSYYIKVRIIMSFRWLHKHKCAGYIANSYKRIVSYARTYIATYYTYSSIVFYIAHINSLLVCILSKYTIKYCTYFFTRAHHACEASCLLKNLEMLTFKALPVVNLHVSYTVIKITGYLKNIAIILLVMTY